jgi:hypothetical protein
MKRPRWLTSPPVTCWWRHHWLLRRTARPRVPGLWCGRRETQRQMDQLLKWIAICRHRKLKRNRTLRKSSCHRNYGIVKNGVVKLRPWNLESFSPADKQAPRAWGAFLPSRPARSSAQETAQIRKLEIRSRGLRLYAAWASGVSNVIQTRAEDWYQGALAKAAGDINSRTPAA